MGSGLLANALRTLRPPRRPRTSRTGAYAGLETRAFTRVGHDWSKKYGPIIHEAAALRFKTAISCGRLALGERSAQRSACYVCTMRFLASVQQRALLRQIGVAFGCQSSGQCLRHLRPAAIAL